MSRWLYAFERRIERERLRRWLIAVLAVYLVLYWLDGAIFRGLYVAGGAAGDAAKQLRAEFEAKPWASMCKSVGYLPVWIAVGAALMLARRAADGARVVGAAALGGALAEALKPVVAQVRPWITDGDHEHAWSGVLEGEKISFGMASSHAGVAFGAAWMLVFLYGRPAWVAVVLAAGCATERMMAGAHFATDVYVGAVLGYAGARLLRPGGWSGTREGLLLP